MLIFDDIGVLVHAEDAGRGSHRQFSHVVQELTVFADTRHVIQAAGIEQIFPIGHDDVLVIESLEDRDQGPSVPLVSHSTAIVTLALRRKDRRMNGCYRGTRLDFFQYYILLLKL